MALATEVWLGKGGAPLGRTDAVQNCGQITGFPCYWPV